MGSPTLQAVCFALVPGFAENIEEYALRAFNFRVASFAWEAKISRKALYTGIAIAAIGGAGWALSRGSAYEGGWHFLTVTGGSIAVCTVPVLYRAAETFHRVMSHAMQRAQR